ncbi:hypothetical protein SAMN05216361_0532 [Marisediminitalea aggregata]|uniref:Uncharacterized protein n=1 Tax=Marisediminitalea aggregata TaxID=634436 RepID=A0A1M5ETC7_9ALTE|nr:hypothetical protein [Marisediminitalea aggregata]SHF82459.1 hypothetical protein SAMN05216361_0532 [Marisediminitalea aggregata]
MLPVMQRNPDSLPGHPNRQRKLKSWILVLPVCFLALPFAANANAGVPMLFLAMPALLMSLLPIIFIESVYCAQRLSLSFGQSLKTVSISNLASTLVGIPVTWLLLVGVQIATSGGRAYGIDSPVEKVLAVTWQAPWLIPYETDLHWMIPAAGLVLLVPFYFASWWSEFWVAKKLNTLLPTSDVKLAVRNANRITYCLLAGWPIASWLANVAMK